MSKRRAVVGVAISISVIAFVWGCGTDGVRMVGDAMVEAGTGLRDSGADASAQDTCTHWEVSSIERPNSGFPTRDVPVGWEPFAANEFNVLTRRCVP